MEIYIYIDNVRVRYDYLRQFEYISAFCDEYSTRNPIFSSFYFFFNFLYRNFYKHKNPVH